MAEFDWPGLMAEVNASILGWEDIDQFESPEVIASGWLGFPAASEAEIVAAEARLGARLPPSYRQFLAFSNGWRTLTKFIYTLWPAEQVEWYAVRRPELVAAVEAVDYPPIPDAEYFDYGPNQDPTAYREENITAGLEVSDYGDGIVVLSPHVVTAEGEWEAIFAAPWLPGARRYQTFWDLVRHEHRWPPE